MSHMKLHPRQAAAWMLLSLLAPMCHASGAGWGSVLLASAALLPLSTLPGDFDRLPPWALWLEWGTVVLTAALLLPESGGDWPGRYSKPVVALVLLVLAGLSHSPGRSARACAALAMLALPMVLLVGLLAGKELRLCWLCPGEPRWEMGLLLPLLLPRLQLLWKERGKTPVLLTAGLGAAALTALVQGILSPRVAAMESAPFYQMACSLRLGSLSRLEPLVSAVLTFSWYALSAYLVMAGAALLTRTGLEQGRAVWLSAGAMAALILSGWQLPRWSLLALALLGWILTPILPLQNKSKKIKKDEKRC